MAVSLYTSRCATVAVAKGLGLLRLSDLSLTTQLGLERLGIHPSYDFPGLDNITVVDQDPL